MTGACNGAPVRKIDWEHAWVIRKYYTGSLIFTLLCLGLGAWVGWEYTGTMLGTLGILWIVFVLGILEVSLSFDNAVVNATVLKDMDEKWRRRFLTWGICHRRVRHAHHLPGRDRRDRRALRPGPIELRLAAPSRSLYEHYIEEPISASPASAGAFLAMVGLKFFFDSDKDVHWIAVVEKQLPSSPASRGRDRRAARRALGDLSAAAGRGCEHLPDRRHCGAPHLHRRRGNR
jgi:hypothetical protein